MGSFSIFLSILNLPKMLHNFPNVSQEPFPKVAGKCPMLGQLQLTHTLMCIWTAWLLTSV
jgi:hypothetical protein